MKNSASPAWKCRVGMRFLMLGATGIVSACGGNSTVPGPAAGDAGREVLLEVLDGSTDGGMACQTFPDAAGPEVPALLTFDGGVPLDRLAYALAVVRCNYWNRCSPLAPYVIGQCIDALSHNGAWNFTTRTWRAGIMGETISFGFPNAALFQAVAAGLVKYDPDQESACLQALQAQSCHGDDLWENVPACAGIFTCPPDAEGDGDGGPIDGAAADGGAVCPALLEPWQTTAGETLLPCSAAIDCVGRATPGGPYCVDGYCAPGLCGSSYFGCNGSETAGQPCSCPFVEAGQPCDADPPVLGNTFEGTPVARWALSICAPGLTCAGLRADGTHGVCSVPQDIGGPCAQDSVIQGCNLGLTCQCGACQLPPTRGPCASLSCQVGIAYCDLQSNTCMPVKQIGGDCSAGMQVCPPNLVCDDTSTCELYSPL
jgi:hypothetical protein